MRVQLKISGVAWAWLYSWLTRLAFNEAALQLHIVSYNDVYSMEAMQGPQGTLYGGVSRFAHFVKQLREKEKHVLVLFAGGTLSPSLWSSIFQGQQMIEAHNALGCDFATLGNHEFDLGLEALRQAMNSSRFAWLAANVLEKKDEQDEMKKGENAGNGEEKGVFDYLLPHALHQVGNVTIGLFGVMLDMHEDVRGVRFANPIEAAKEQVKILKEKKAHFIIALTHQFWNDDNEFASLVPGIDLILGGHDHDAMMQKQFGAPYLKADMDFKSTWLTRIQFKEENDTGLRYVMNHELIHMTEDLPTDTNVDKLIGKYKVIAEKQFSQVIGTSCRALDIRQSVVRRKENSLANYVAEALQKAYDRWDVDVAFMNGGGLRTNQIFTAKNITTGDILSWCPFEDVVVVLRVTGRTLRDLLDFQLSESCGAEGTAMENGFLPHPAGCRYQYVCSGYKEGWVESLMWPNKQLINPEKPLTIAFPGYIYETHKHFFSARNSSVLVDVAIAIPMDVAIRNHVLRTKEICTEIDGRLELVTHKSYLDYRS